MIRLVALLLACAAIVGALTWPLAAQATTPGVDGRRNIVEGGGRA